MNEITQKTANLAALATYERPSANSPTLDIPLILRRQKWPLVLGAVFGLGLGIVHYATSPKRYYAASSILISEQANSPQDQLTTSVPVLRNETTVLNEMQVLRSLQLAQRVVDELDLHGRDGFLSPSVSAAREIVDTLTGTAKSLVPVTPDSASQTAEVTEEDLRLDAALLLQKDVGLERVGRTFAVEISYIHEDPELAAAIVNAYADTYLRDQQLTNRADAARSAEWLRNHIDEVHERANAAAAEAEAFRLEKGASNVQALRLREQRVSSLNALHASLLTRYELIAIEGSSPVANGRILSAAVVPTSTALPKAWRLLAVGLVLGLIAGVAMATWRETRETTFREGREMREITGLPFLGYLDRFKPSQLPRLFKQFYQSMARGKGNTLFRWLPVRDNEEERENHMDIRKCAPSYLLPVIAPNAPYCETLKNVRATINLTASRGDSQVIAVGSLDHREGRSTIAANLAQLAALEGQPTLLIDADLSNPELSRQLGFHDEVGLRDVIDGRVPLDHAIFKLPETGLSILPGRVRSSEARISTVCKLGSILSLARQQFATIVIDFQPLGTCSDLKSNLSDIDAVVLMALWGKTSKHGFKQYVENEPQLRAKTAGVILNNTLTKRLALYGAAEPGKNRKRYPGFA